MSNQLSTKALFERDDVKQKFRELLGKRSTSFITSVLQIAAQNHLLANADPVSIYQAAAVAATLDLPLNQNLGFAYIVPYNQRFKDERGAWQTKQVAQFQMGYKGFIQLAQRSGQFKSIYSTPVYEGQIVEANPLDGYVFDFSKRTSDTVVGYAAKFKLLNGFEATWYMSIDQLRTHGAKYSKTFNNDKGLWNTDFDSMANKTVIKLLLSKFAPLSVEMQKAVISDQSVIINADAEDVAYIDNGHDQPNKEEERLALMIGDAKKVADLVALQPELERFPDLAPVYENKFSELTENEM